MPNSSSVAVRTAPTPWSGWVIAMFATFSFSIAPPLTKAALNLGLEPTTLLVLRYLAAALLLLVTIWLTNRQNVAIDRRGLTICVAAGVLFWLAVLSFTWALTRLNASLATMIGAAYPLVVLVLLALRGEHFTYRNIVRLIVGFGGIYLLIGPGGQVDLIGVLLVLCTSLTYSLYLVTIQWYLKDYQAQTVTLYVVSTIAVCMSGLWLAQGAVWQAPEWRGWLLVGLLVLVSTYLGQLALFAAVRGIGSGQMALLSPIETLLTITWSVLFLGEWLSLWQWLGGALILVSMLLAMRRIRRAQRIDWRARLRLRL